MDLLNNGLLDDVEVSRDKNRFIKVVTKLEMPKVFLVKELILNNVEILHIRKPGSIVAYVVIEDCRRFSSITDYPDVSDQYDEDEWGSQNNFIHAQIITSEDGFSIEEKDVLSEMVLTYIKSKPNVDLLVTFTTHPRAFESLIHFDEKPSLFFEELLSLTESEYSVSNVTKDSLSHLTQIQ